MQIVMFKIEMPSKWLRNDPPWDLQFTIYDLQFGKLGSAAAPVALWRGKARVNEPPRLAVSRAGCWYTMIGTDERG